MHSMDLGAGIIAHHNGDSEEIGRLEQMNDSQFQAHILGGKA